MPIKTEANTLPPHSGLEHLNASLISPLTSNMTLVIKRKILLYTTPELSLGS